MKEQNQEYIAKWETLIDAVDKTDIPLEFVNSISLEFFDHSVDAINQDINIKSLRKSGYDDSLIEDIVHQAIAEYEDNIKSLNYFIDIEYVASTVQEQTDKLLINI